MSLLERVSGTRQRIRSACAEFSKTVPNYLTLRNVGEHLDEYLIGRGRDPNVHYSGLQAWASGEEDGNAFFEWLGVRLYVGSAEKAADALYGELLEAVKGLE